jgi:hypothetical protein
MNNYKLHFSGPFVDSIWANCYKLLCMAIISHRTFCVLQFGIQCHDLFNLHCDGFVSKLIVSEIKYY